MKNSVSFHISAQNIDCGYLLELPQQGGSIEYPQLMFLSRNNKIYVYPCKPQFYCLWGPKLYRRVFMMSMLVIGPVVREITLLALIFLPAYASSNLIFCKLFIKQITLAPYHTCLKI